MLTLSAHPDFPLAGTSAAVQKLRAQVQRAGPYFRSALLVGENGCLKEQIARALQQQSPLRQAAFQVHAAASFSLEHLNLSGPATLYVPGIEEVRPEVQAGLLARLNQTASGTRAELRFLCSTEVAPRALVAAGRLHPELYGVISAVELRVSPLRERLDDLPALIGNLEIDITAMDALRRYCWPGNFRELQEVLRTCCERAGNETIRLEHFPLLEAPAPRKEEELRLETAVWRHVQSVLEGCAGNKLQAAARLGISRSTLYRMLDANGAPGSL